MTDDVLATEIAGRLRRDILLGNLPPGAAVKERDNAARLGVSRTPLREAIRILASERLVDLRPLRSPVVANPSLTEIADQIVVMAALERLSAELACRNATADDIDRLAALNARMQALYDAPDYLDLFEADMAFHAGIAAASRNAALAETHRSYLSRLWRARYLAARLRRNRDRVRAHHDAIMAALLARDAVAVVQVIDAHLGQLTADIGQAMAAEQADRTAEGMAG